MTRDGKLLLLVLGVGAVLLGTGTIVAVTGTPRGIRNNNPGNIEKGQAWQGLDAAKTAAEPRFAVFVSPEYGIRALARVLKNYSALYGLNSVAQIINRWAPPSDNDTGAYVVAVARALGVDPGATISVESRLSDLIKAIIRHENGTQPYSASTIQAGINLERNG